MSQQVAPHIQILLDNEGTEARLMWGRTSKNQIWISTVGYKHQAHMDLEKALLKAGCGYDFEKGFQEFDRVCGRTFTHFREPKRKAARGG